MTLLNAIVNKSQNEYQFVTLYIITPWFLNLAFDFSFYFNLINLGKIFSIFAIHLFLAITYLSAYLSENNHQLIGISKNYNSCASLCWHYCFFMFSKLLYKDTCSCWDCCHICFSRCKKAYWTEVWWHCCTVRHEALAIHCYKWQHTPQSSSWIQRGDQGLLPRGNFFHGAYKDEGNCRGIPWKSKFLSNTLPSYSA